MMMTREEMAARLAAIQTRHNLDKQGLALYLGVPVTTVHNWLIGSREPSASTVRLLDVLALLETFNPELHDTLIER